MSDRPLPLPLKAAPRICDWIRFEAERKTTILTGRVELGQGNLTALAQMAADELGLEPEDLTVVSGNTQMTPDEGYTAGSLSVSMGGIALRLAAAAARTVILREAARRLNADFRKLTVAGARIRNEGIDTGNDLRDIAIGLDFSGQVADLAEPLAASARRQSGRSVPRRDLRDRMLGTPFVQDLVMDGMVHGRIVHPPALGAVLAGLDMDALAARSGVIDVFRDGSVVGLLAGTMDQAHAAADWAVRMAEWRLPPGPAAVPIAEMLAGAAEAETTVLETGDMGEVGSPTIEGVASRGYLSHGSIGPSAAVAEWDGEHLRIWTHSQGVFQLRKSIATVLELDPEAISIVHAPGAGCYGHNGADDVAFDAALLAFRAPGRPVKVIWSRRDEFTVAPLGAAMTTSVRGWTTFDGSLSAAEIVVTSPPHGNRPDMAGATNLVTATRSSRPVAFTRSNDVPLPQGGADRNAVPYYTIPNVRVGKRLVHDLPYRSSAIRGLGAHLNTFAIEMLMEMAAAKAGVAPVEYRLRHLDDPRARAVIETVVDKAATATDRLDPEREGWGIGFGRYKNVAAYAAVIACVRMDETISVSKVFAAVDGGEIINPDGALNQLEGGVLQSVSWTLKESVPLDGPAVAATGWLDYPILRFSEVPDVDITLMDHPLEPPLGCGEAMQGPVAGAIGSALFQLLGVPVLDLPLTRDRVMAAMLT